MTTVLEEVEETLTLVNEFHDRCWETVTMLSIAKYVLKVKEAVVLYNEIEVSVSATQK